MIPKVGAVLEMPELLHDSARFLRIHNRTLKAVLRDVLAEHHKMRVPGHFLATARNKYGYYPRSARYKSYKMRVFKSRTDLVKTGKTKAAMVGTAPTIRVGGRTGGSRGIRATMVMRFPFPNTAGSNRKGGHQKVTQKRMAEEIEALTPAEVAAINKSIAKRYHAALKTEIQKRGMRIKIT